MAKTDVTLNPGTGGATVLTDLIGSDYYPASKIIIGAEGVDGGFVSDGNPMPVTGTVNVPCDTVIVPASAGVRAGEISVTWRSIASSNSDSGKYQLSNRNLYPHFMTVRSFALLIHEL